MPLSIALVGRGRCRPSPDAVSEGASSDRDAGRIVTDANPSWPRPAYIGALYANLAASERYLCFRYGAVKRPA